MTSDAKVGLLLGLVLIFIIAFIINGLPSFHKDANGNELTTNMVSSQTNSLGLADEERKAREVIDQIKPVRKPLDVGSYLAGKQDIRFSMQLPKNASSGGAAVGVKAVAAAQSLPAAEKDKIRKAELNKTTLPKIYVVNEGDNLAAVAKKFYGSREGNKEINIARIFEANRKLLRSPDEIYEGQKIVIPPLRSSYQNKNKTDDIFTSTMFKKVDSIGKRRLLTDGREAKQRRWYVVQEGDSLWQIAAEQLGGGCRHTEIGKLNADILDDEDHLWVGMRLKLPAR